MVAKLWSFDSKLPHNKSNPAVLLFIHPWKMSIPMFWCCSNKEVFSDGEFGLGDHLLNTQKKKAPNKMDFSFVPKQEKNKINKINNNN
jgi:hypothetical protein